MTTKEVIIDAGMEPEDPFEFLLQVTRRYGDAVRYRSPLGPTYLFNHPDYIKEVLQSPQFQRTTLVKLVLGDGLLASDGAYWKRQRRLAQPFFRQDRLTGFEPLIQAHTRVMLDRWAEVADSGRPVDVAAEMTRLTLSIIVEALFGVNLESRIDELCRAIQVLMEDLGNMGCTQLNTPLRFSPTSSARFNSALKTVDEITASIIDERRRGPHDPDNLLCFLLSARDEPSGASFTDRQIRDEVVTLMISGHETTSLILSWAWSLLAQNPEVERAFHEELNRALDEDLPGFADLEALPFTLMILQESMRLYPPVWFIARKTVHAGHIGDLHVPENVLVIVSPYAVHRHASFWKDPESFDPLRFSPGSTRPKYAYIPFGGGRHLCLGMHLALIEGQLILAAVGHHYRIRLVAGHPVEPQPAITLRQRNGLMATLDKRRPLPAD